MVRIDWVERPRSDIRPNLSALGIADAVRMSGGTGSALVRGLKKVKKKKKKDRSSGLDTARRIRRAKNLSAPLPKTSWGTTAGTGGVSGANIGAAAVVSGSVHMPATGRRALSE
jgi:hypothetical protein